MTTVVLQMQGACQEDLWKQGCERLGGVLGKHLDWLCLVSSVAWCGSWGPLKLDTWKEWTVLGEAHFHALGEQLSRCGVQLGDTAQELGWVDPGH